MPVLHHQVVVEEAERLLVRRRRESDREGVEVVEHLSPEAVDRAVALVNDHDVALLRRQPWVVLHRQGFGRQLVGGVLVKLWVELRLAAQDRVDPLDRRDRHVLPFLHGSIVGGLANRSAGLRAVVADPRRRPFQAPPLPALRLPLAPEAGGRQAADEGVLVSTLCATLPVRSSRNNSQRGATDVAARARARPPCRRIA